MNLVRWGKNAIDPDEIVTLEENLSQNVIVMMRSGQRLLLVGEEASDCREWIATLPKTVPSMDSLTHDLEHTNELLEQIRAILDSWYDSWLAKR